MAAGNETRASYRFDRVVRGDGRTRAEAQLLSTVFNDPRRFTERYIDWQYYENPDGDIVGFDAFDSNGDLAGHYVTQPLRARLWGREERGVLSLNTATHPAHQGRGLFVELAKRTFDLARAQGYAFVVGVANANSTPGFLRKLNFSLVRPLDALIGFGNPGRSPEVDLDLERLWSADARSWRIRQPGAQYWTRGGRLYCASGYSGVSVCLAENTEWQTTENNGQMTILTLRLGLHPASVAPQLWMPIPQLWRPSPLNLIYLPLREDLQTPRAERIQFESIDFDAY